MTNNGELVKRSKLHLSGEIQALKRLLCKKGYGCAKLFTMLSRDKPMGYKRAGLMT